MPKIYDHPTAKGATVYTQNQTKNLYISFYDQNNQRVQKSAKTRDKEEAIKFLEKQIMLIEMVKSGDFIIQKQNNRKQIKTICDILIEQINEVEEYQNLKPTILHLKKVKEKLGHMNIEELRRTDISVISSISQSATKINNYKKVLNMILEYALDHKYINNSIKLGKFNKKEAIKRESIDILKHETIIQEIFKESEVAKKQVSRENMFLLSRFIWFLRLTGIRKGEAVYIKLDDFTEDDLNVNKDEPNKIYLNIRYSKVRKRKILVTHEAFDIIKDIIIYYAYTYNYIKTREKDAFIFSRTDGIIPQFTDRLKDFKDRHKEFFKSIDAMDYCLYTERHSFICDAIRRNVRIDDLAEHCGTSYNMIQNFYRDELATRNISTIYDRDKYGASFFGEKEEY
ncbi:hypothetical protein [Shewanella xiamenensis]|uniref:hypothetical protein n=1 Tax=Shewanella xiamenensis TaxID=332186 RepID=UPI002948D03B|nr:hypothetical protein [Shewanella xiamenensis]MDV5246063.1 hypothetical protein [Shewanella xiamenensis]